MANMHYVSYPTEREPVAVSRNESGQRCSGPSAANANECAVFFRRGPHLIKSTSHREHGAAVLSAGRNTEPSGGSDVEKEMSFWGLFLAQLEIKDLITDKRG